MSRALALLALAVACSKPMARPDRTPPLAAEGPEAAAAEAARTDGPGLSREEMIEHVLSRATFGPRPRDRERVARIGVAAFLEEQLHPERLDDGAATQRLEAYPVLRRDSRSLVRELVEMRQMKKEGAASGMVRPGLDFVGQLAAAKVVRATLSERQLQEVMADFWFNHFNVFAGKETEAALVPEYDALIRANALGSFPELLAATAHSAAMLVYLDNWRSQVRAGINENYARELLELHTLGVEGGYSQADIVEVARCFTGWTIVKPREDPSFVFRPRMHDFGAKRVLGHVLPAGGGERDGDEVLRLLAEHPSTARFIAGKLVRRFVSDDPPETLVTRVAATYARTGGDIRSMLRTIFEAPEMWSRKALKAKVRSPLEHVAASVRALDASVADPQALVRAIGRIGEPLYAAQPPTGYGDTAQSWLASGALLARIDFGLQLANGQLPGVKIDLRGLGDGDPEVLVANVARQLGAGELSDRTRDHVLRELRSSPPRVDIQAARAVGLLLGAPEVQRR